MQGEDGGLWKKAKEAGSAFCVSSITLSARNSGESIHTLSRIMWEDVFESLTSIGAFGLTAVGTTAWKRRMQRGALRRVRESTRKLEPSSSSSRLIRHLSGYSDWSDYKEDEECFIQDFPKVELHVVSTTDCDETLCSSKPVV